MPIGKKVTAEEQQRIQELLRQEGVSPRVVAERFGLSADAVRRIGRVARRRDAESNR